ncbi:hypothetical protein CPB83DRAFT_859211 [Crepidotus variabilis]|uniref:Uncharacterized protein n=1 Tax=Crepidotus variabilis TaxID=179855 RepID=A0A9P6EAM3_9AGAR|nr:hypothetical protein CPB83DRAFT_859211 [Crepidotus variabilis]
MTFSSVWITIASLIYVFDIEKETNEYGSPIEPNPSYVSGLLFAPETVPCRIKPCSKEFEKLIEAHNNWD